MNKKKDEHDALAARHIHQLWTEDLDSLLIALEKQEAIDERDRLAHKGMANNGKKGGCAKAKTRAPPANKLGKEETKKGVSAPKIKKTAGAAKGAFSEEEFNI